ncbi:MAG: magnesium transporter [Verrucomicrobia bacterium GWF2_51_19]|nr:MAG: magnesium transporter [Verrucomicrobia bacterium GWF2_51_19]HCJ11974.1 magnesium transporter [Opitutae bacterium]
MPEVIQNHVAAQQLDQYSFDDLLVLGESNFESIDPEKLARTSPYEISRFLERLDLEEQKTFLKKLGERQVSDVLAEMNAEDSAELITAIREYRAVKILESLGPDDAVDLVSELDEEDRVRLLAKMHADKALTIQKLLSYDPDTAGGVMTPIIPTVHDNLTVDQAIDHVRHLRHDIENIYDLYVVDAHKHLLGTVSLRRLILSDPGQPIAAVMKKELPGICHPNQDKEEVARAMAEYNLREIPVVDKSGKLLGVVTHDDVIDILQAEATEDLQKLHGAGADESITDTIKYSVLKRTPWLLINLLTAYMSVAAIAHFQSAIAQSTLLAVFMTLVMSLGGNTGAQTLAVSIRGLALGEFHDRDSLMLCLKEMLKGSISGFVVGISSGLLSVLFTHNIWVGVTVSAAMILNMTLSGLVGAFIPIVLHRLKFDPAQSSYIFLTAITDVSGIVIFLSLGKWLILK